MTCFRRRSLEETQTSLRGSSRRSIKADSYARDVNVSEDPRSRSDEQPELSVRVFYRLGFLSSHNADAPCQRAYLRSHRGTSPLQQPPNEIPSQQVVSHVLRPGSFRAHQVKQDGRIVTALVIQAGQLQVKRRLSFERRGVGHVDPVGDAQPLCRLPRLHLDTHGMQIHVGRTEDGPHNVSLTGSFGGRPRVLTEPVASRQAKHLPYGRDDCDKPQRPVHRSPLAALIKAWLE